MQVQEMQDFTGRHAAPHRAKNEMSEDGRSCLSLDDAMQDYQAAKIQLHAARQGLQRIQAWADLEKARITLSRIFEQIWPDP